MIFNIKKTMLLALITLFGTQTKEAEPAKKAKLSISKCISRATCKKTLVQNLEENHPEIAKAFRSVETLADANTALSQLDALSQAKVTAACAANSAHLKEILKKELKQA